MTVGILRVGEALDRILDYSTQNLRIEKFLIELGLDPNNVTYEAIFNRLLDLALANITFSTVLALVGGIFLISTFVVRTIVPMRILCIVSGVFLLGSAALSGSIPQFFLYLLALPINVIRLFQIRNLIKRARSSAQGDLSLDWLRPFMTPRHYRKGDVLFRKDDVALEMFLTVSGKFLVTEINIEIPAGRILGELGFVSPDNRRTQSVECIEDGEVLTVSYEKLREIYLQNPEFGYYFLRLTSDRLTQNHARLEGLVEQAKAALAAAKLAHSSKPAAASQVTVTTTDEKKVPDIVDQSRVAAAAAQPSKSEARPRRDAAEKTKEREPAKVITLTTKAIWAAAGRVNRRLKASAATQRTFTTDNVIGLIPNYTPNATAGASAPVSSASAELRLARRRRQAFAIVERYANYSAASGFIPLPIANVAAITAVIVRMVQALHELYGVPFKRNLAYGVAIGLTGGLVPMRLAKLATSTVAHFVPGYNLFGLAVSSVTASAYARKVGRMLIDDFERRAAVERERLALKGTRRWQDILKMGWTARTGA